AARIASVSYQLGLLQDRGLVDGVITRAARPFMNGGIYSDDNPPTGRFDRYSNEYARFVWEAAEAADRKDILDAVRLSLKVQMPCERERQQTTSFFGKAALAQARFARALASDKIAAFSPEITRPDVARFVFFRHGDRPAGVWLVRQGPIYFTLPITTGTKPGVADYLPAPHGLPGFANPVEQVYPSLVPFGELADGRVIVATDGADEIEPGADGKSLRVVWRRWALVGSKAGELVDPRITSEVVWQLSGTMLTRNETLRSSEPVSIRRWRVALPTTGDRNELTLAGTQRWDNFMSANSVLSVSGTSDWSMKTSIFATGDSALGRGARGPAPLHLVYESHDLRLIPNHDLHWRLIM